jgi:hypothetical protein
MYPSITGDWNRWAKREKRRTLCGARLLRLWPKWGKGRARRKWLTACVRALITFKTNHFDCQSFWRLLDLEKKYGTKKCKWKCFNRSNKFVTIRRSSAKRQMESATTHPTEIYKHRRWMKWNPQWLIVFELCAAASEGYERSNLVRGGRRTHIWLISLGVKFDIDIRRRTVIDLDCIPIGDPNGSRLSCGCGFWNLVSKNAECWKQICFETH